MGQAALDGRAVYLEMNLWLNILAYGVKTTRIVFIVNHLQAGEVLRELG